MYLIDKVRAKVARGEPLVGANTTLSDASISELFGLAGCDYVWIDYEHASFTHKEVEQHIMACHAGGTAAFVRIPWNDQVMVKRVLDMGPDGIIFPLIRSYDEALEAVKACRYPPEGIRGWNPLRALEYGLKDNNWYVENADRLIWKILMIEHIEAVNDIDRILGIPEVDAAIIGPSDLSGSMGRLHRNDTEEFWQQIEKIGAAARKHGKVLGTALPPNCPKALMDKWMGYGVNMFSVGQDSFLLSRMLKDNLDACRAMYAGSGK